MLLHLFSLLYFLSTFRNVHHALVYHVTTAAWRLACRQAKMFPARHTVPCTQGFSYRAFNAVGPPFPQPTIEVPHALPNSQSLI